jgi:hypothetical protein
MRKLWVRFEVKCKLKLIVTSETIYSTLYLNYLLQAAPGARRPTACLTPPIQTSQGSTPLVLSSTRTSSGRPRAVQTPASRRRLGAHAPERVLVRPELGTVTREWKSGRTSSSGRGREHQINGEPQKWGNHNHCPCVYPASTLGTPVMGKGLIKNTNRFADILTV